MAKVTRNFTGGKMNKDVDARLVPNGQYIDALNLHNGSTEHGDIGVMVSALGNSPLTQLKYVNGHTELSEDAVTIGAIADSARETIYWFVHDPSFPAYLTGKLDLIVSFNTRTQTLVYHIVSIDDGDGENTTLNFNPSYLINAINLVDNLIFFSDNYNPPRFFNIFRNYDVPDGDVDQFSAESILVIKKPPTQAPTISTFLTQGQQNFISTRYICFGYRYRYADNEYSATSQFSEPAFSPNPFQFSADSYLNEGMVNAFNAVSVTINTGGELVVGFDLLFKEAGSNLIKVIQKINKEQDALADDVDYTFTFDNGKIYTLLPEYEILRLYDNVPLLAQSQTLMGNRLLYGNYIEGYNLIDDQDQPVNLDYTAALVTEDIGTSTIPDTFGDGNYNIDGALNIPDSILELDLSDLTFPLEAGGIITASFTITHHSFSGDVNPVETTTNVEATFSFYLLNSYASVYALASSTEFQNAVGTASNIQTDLGNSCDGNTLTDIVNCQIPNTLDGYEKFRCGIDAQNQPISIITTPASQIIGLQLTATRFVDYTIAPLVEFFEYYSITEAEAFYQEIANPKSLHSNRGYEAAIVYMDEFNRSTTALVSPENTIHIPCSNSATQNKLQITIPYTQRPPTWATRYKFVVKATQENYDTIYSSIIFEDPDSNASYFLVEGENAQKVSAGDRLIVKADTNGLLSRCAYATVLEKEVQIANFITISGVYVPAGVYLKINPNSFAAETTTGSFITYGTMSDSAFDRNTPTCPRTYYPVSRVNEDTGLWEDYTVPAGSRIRLYFNFERRGNGNRCEARTYLLDKTLISTANYDNFKDWWDGDNVESVLDTATGSNIDTSYDSTEGVWPASFPCNFTYHFQFQRDAAEDNRLLLVVNGVQSCTGLGDKDKLTSKVSVQIDVYRAENLLIFETQPSETLPDVYFENHLSFAITNGNHQGNTQNQVISTQTPAIIDTEFFNCYCFGNGAESYKIRDSAIGNTFNLGNRVISVSAQDYKQAHRFADITYSGVYNDESNVNKFNEFNLGLINYKPLEDSFGPIYILDGRQTDVLVLQEDRVSYVLAGKNLLSDATGGGAVTSVPEVLGTQLARVEKNGISQNPESYAVWGINRFFTDVKRGAVIQIVGNSYSNDQLILISEMGMRTYFRDAFIEDSNTQKLGAYDPFLNEYVLSMNDKEIPGETPCVDCSIRQEFTIAPYEDKEYCIDVGLPVGETIIEWTVIQGGVPFEITATYNGSDTSTGTVTGNGSLIVNKNLQLVKNISLLIQSTASLDMTISVGCVAATPINLVEICLTNDADSGKYIHNEFMFTSGSYTSPKTSNLITFATGTDNPLVSRYNILTGQAGSGSIPNSGATVRMICNQIGFDDFDFNTTNNSFKYYKSATLYPNTPAGIAALLALASTATPNQGSGTNHYAEFTQSGLNTYIYLIWDYRSATAVDLCYSETLEDACCDCEECSSNCREYFISNSSSNTFVQYRDCYTGGLAQIEIEPYHGYFVESDMNYPPQIVSGTCDIVTTLGCGEDTCPGCVTFDIEVFEDASISYTTCAGTPTVVPLSVGEYEITTDGTVPFASSGIITINFGRCGS